MLIIDGTIYVEHENAIRIQVSTLSIPRKRSFSLKLPNTCNILSLFVKKGSPYMSILTNIDNKPSLRHFRLYYDEDFVTNFTHLQYLGTFNFDNGLTGHLFEDLSKKVLK